jgi:hypothetical protein
MGKRITFKLVDTSLNNKVIGEVTFYDEKVLFKLDQSILPESWEKVGIIPYHESRRSSKENSIAYFITSRLPLRLRKASSRQQFDYILASGLRVASDPYALFPA